jgi:glycosyltransferase involved in cell wall biosynthesis
MKIAVVNNMVPFVSGGAEYLAAALAENLKRHGHEAMVIRYPFRWQPAEKILESMLACRLVRIINTDRVIALKFPAYYVPHDNKVIWLLHQFRQAYELWGTEWQDIPATEEGRQIRDAIIQSDNKYLPEAKAIFANSQVTAERLRRFNGLQAEVLYPPLLKPEQFWCEEYGDYFFYPSRITAGKRQHLALQAMQHTRTRVKLVIAGGPETEGDLRRLEELASDSRIQSRVTILPRFISEEEKADLFRRALGCIYTPVDEDSYGFVTLEAYHCRKPVISCTDSGGVSLVVKHGQTGYLEEPDPRRIAAAMDELYRDRRRARDLGEAGFAHVTNMGINWDRVVEKLTA